MEFCAALLGKKIIRETREKERNYFGQGNKK
jgi:hypothetical protein